jgi:hypothetical protein
MTPDYPEDLQDAFDRLGPPREEFQGSAANAIAGMILGTLGMIVGAAGTVFIVVALFVMGPDVRMISGLMMPILAYGSWLTFRWAIRNRSARMYVCENGIVHFRAGTVTLYPFAELTQIMQDKVKDGLDENGTPFMNRGTTFLIKRQDGAELAVDANLLKQHVRFMRAVYSATRPFDVPWVLYQG